MYPIPQLALQIEAEWAPELGEHFGRLTDQVLEKVRPWFDFPEGLLRIELMDGSAVQFNRAFHIVNEAKRAIAVFTEHCGHHVFPHYEAKIYRDGRLVYAQAA
ncbi:hypothetical protein QRD43_07660 [Pelomonas sp. APW6]|uniref:Uncharacterized protein n=1 Tax=Roseateles subflavus TaxID=3053353 RepID=A0ABT7LHM8_9BURK|nr:hypothetical protein [Pelomonas sp. APW6]MDL5031782.1 hypothetical protein [Pelomonas sp. APW6]